MTPQHDDEIWRTRFIQINMVRLGGTAIVFLGLAIWYTNLLVQGGTIVLGLPLALGGLEQLPVADQVSNAKAGHSRLPGAEEFSRAPQF